MDDILSQIIAYAPDRIDTETKARALVQGPRNMYNQGQLVQPNADGSRPGYSGSDKYITPSRRSGAEGFQGKKFISVKDPSYSDGRKRVKTPEYEKYLKEEIEKSKQRPDRYSKGNTRREPGLLRIAEAMQQADIYDNPEYMMPNKEAMKAREKDFGRKQKIYKNGMLQAGDIVYINGLEKNFDDVIFIADQLGEDPDWVLDQLDERINFRDFEKDKKDVYKKDPKYTKPRNDYLKVENWVQRNAKKYANPDTFENALIKRFGKDNQFVKDMNSNKGRVTSYFSDDFKKMMFNADPRTQIIPSHLKQFIKSSLYNFNPKIKNAVTEEIKGIFNSENLPKLRLEARNLLNNNKLLAKFGINKAITGPFAKVIQAEIGTDMWNDITNFRNPRVGTSEMLSTLKNLVDPEFKPMFEETIKAINFSKKNQWQKAKDVFGLADDIMWDHKVPSSIIDKGYADRIESIKVNPTSKDFNARIKNAGFDRPINKLITKFEKATTLDAKAKIKNEMDIVKNNFSKKYGGYLDEVSINLDSKGNLKFLSSASPLSMSDNRVKMLEKSMVQEFKAADAFDINTPEGRLNMKKLNTSVAFQKFLKDNGIVVPGCGRQKVVTGGRITFSNGTCGGFKNADEFAKGDPENFLNTIQADLKASKAINNADASVMKNVFKWAAKDIKRPTGWIGGDLAISTIFTAGGLEQGQTPLEAVDQGLLWFVPNSALKKIGFEYKGKRYDLGDAYKKALTKGMSEGEANYIKKALDLEMADKNYFTNKDELASLEKQLKDNPKLFGQVTSEQIENSKNRLKKNMEDSINYGSQIFKDLADRHGTTLPGTETSAKNYKDAYSAAQNNLFEAKKQKAVTGSNIAKKHDLGREYQKYLNDLIMPDILEKGFYRPNKDYQDYDILGEKSGVFTDYFPSPTRPFAPVTATIGRLAGNYANTNLPFADNLQDYLAGIASSRGKDYLLEETTMDNLTQGDFDRLNQFHSGIKRDYAEGGITTLRSKYEYKK